MTTPDAMPVFSVVLPAYNEGENIPAMTERLRDVMAALGEPFEILWVNDGSTDGTEAALERLAADDARVRALHFARNFGHMAALTAGLEAARATGAVVCMDADGQHAPELLPELVAHWRAGADIVQAVRCATPHEPAVKRAGSRLFYRLLNHLGGLDLEEGSADFRLMDRQAVDALNSLPERDRFVRGLVHWVGFRRETVPYDAAPRLAGETKYSLFKMLAFALSGITSFSVRPLRLAFLTGVVVTGFAGLYALFILWCYVAGIPLVRGWTSMLLVVLFLSGVQLVFVGIVSEYVARLFLEQKHRPVYLLRKPRRPGDA